MKAGLHPCGQVVQMSIGEACVKEVTTGIEDVSDNLDKAQVVDRVVLYFTNDVQVVNTVHIRGMV